MLLFKKKPILYMSVNLLQVKAVCTKLDELIDIIRVDQKNRGRNEEALAMDILDRSSTELNGEFLHSQLLIDVLIRMKPSQQDKNELLTLLKKEYKTKGLFKKDEYYIYLFIQYGYAQMLEICNTWVWVSVQRREEPTPTPTPSRIQ